ncbi:hypothetical protein [Constantimarinum furrinae]|uniref:Uncharacterized protein n=1 Tax=Constantimarinum furrinae TaxID=2562285 RepID=A0A7G8PWF9_9FLAO|nr:hypothetical protein [Constantimarinum furrinae]QNJ98675.1 hypothetical protein ALE3EI_2129 [Constantimarinum furrinae]
MKNLKLLITVISLIMFSHSSIYGQGSTNQPSDGYSLQIPTELKATEAELNVHELISVSHYDQNLNGYVYIKGIINSNKEAKLYSVQTPKRPVSYQRSPGCTGGNYNACARDCTKRSNTYGIILCTGYCFIDCIIFEE